MREPLLEYGYINHMNPLLMPLQYNFLQSVVLN